MVALHIILWYFALVLLGLFLQIIHREFLLEQGITLVLLIGKHPADGCSVPLVFTAWGLDTHLRKFRRYAVGCHAFKESSEYQLYDFRLFLVDHDVPIRSLLKTKHTGVGEADLSVSKTLSVSPCDILGNGAAFFLCQ